MVRILKLGLKEVRFDKVKASKFGQMDPSMKGCGNIVKLMEKGV